MATETTPLTHRRLSRRASSRRGEVAFTDEHIDMDGSFKAAVFGFNDGLCANTCLMIGIASASNITPFTVISSGIVGLLAGAASMGAGEWISMTLNNSAEKREVERERQHIIEHESAEDRNLQAKLREEFGFSENTINSLFKDMATGDREKDLEMKLRLNAKLELGLDIDETSGNPYKAMFFMMSAFALGASVPLLPWLPLWYPGPVMATWMSALCALVASLVVGMRLAYLTDEPPISTAFRQVWAATIAIFSVWFVGYLYQLATGMSAPSV